MEQFKRFLKAFRPALTVTLVFMLVCGLGYPLLMNGLSGMLFPKQANGNLVTVAGKPIGSKHVGQEFTADFFMKGRPSSVHYNTYTVNENGQKVYLDGSKFAGLASGSSNYGPSNPALAERVETDMAEFLAAHPDVKPEDIPTDLMTASASGLDPHISPEAAAIQLPKIAEASGLSMEVLEQIVQDNTTGKLLGIFGEEVVNVLGVNAGIAEAMGLTQ